MKKQLLSLILAGFLLASCGPDPEDSDTSECEGDSCDTNSEASSGSDTSSVISSTSSSTTSSELVFDYNDGEALEYGDVDTPYTVGTGTNTTDSFDYDDIYVNTPTNELNEDFMFCVDVSSAYEVEKYGGRFYDKDGNEEDIFVMMKEGGANYARLRLWNDPYDASGNPYGGGTNDLSTDIYLAKRAQDAGLKIMVDFHYSDHWADPSKQWRPKAWSDLKNSQIYSAIGEYTSGVLNAFKEANITVDAVQIGNEINNGIAGLSGYGGYPYARSIKAGYTTARSVFPNIKTILHLTNVESAESSIYPLLNYLISNDAFDLDIIGLSYYPFWDGSFENVLGVMNYIVKNYDKQVMIAETSYGYTLDYPDGYANNQFASGSVESGGYLATIQGQATEMAEIIDLVSQVPNKMGVGISYWETGWLPVQGSTWATKEGEYYNTYGCDPDYDTNPNALDGYSESSTYSSWANQAWFTYKGRMLPSAYTYKYVQEGGHAHEATVTKCHSATSYTGAYDRNAKVYSIPSTVSFETDLDSLIEVDIEWNQEEYDGLADKNVGTYTIHGTATCGGLTVDLTCTVDVLNNYVSDFSFEGQTTLQSGSNGKEYEVGDPWELTRNDAHVRVEQKEEMPDNSGKYFHWWSETGSLNFELSQDLGTIGAGSYDFYCSVNAEWYLTYTYDKIGLFVEINGTRTEYSMNDGTHLAGFNAGNVTWQASTITLSSSSSVTIGVYCENGAQNAWAHLDDVYFVDHL